MFYRTVRTFFGHALHLLLVLWLTITMLFLALSLIRGNPVSLFIDPRLGPELQTRLKERYGYDRGALFRYWSYLRNVATGELGVSFTHKKPVGRVLRERIGTTLWLGSFGLGLGILGSFLLLLGLHHPSLARVRSLCRTLTAVCLTVPSFLFATLFIGVFGVRLGLFPIFGSQDLFAMPTSWWSRLKDLAYHGFLPALSLALPVAGYFAAYLDRQLKDLEEAPFIVSARGRGVAENRILLNHKFRTIMPGFIQLVGLHLPMVAGGALVIEAMFGWSGIGLMLFDAVLSRDYPLLLGGCLWTALFVIAGYELADALRGEAKLENEAL